jgi:alcohol dehydrogenase (cytochrome c)
MPRVSHRPVLLAALMLFDGRVAWAMEAPETYTRDCAMCHGVRLEGGDAPNYGPPLRGEVFIGHWGSASESTLVDYIAARMPLNRPGTLDSASATTLAAYLRQENNVNREFGEPTNVARAEALTASGPFAGDKNLDEAYRIARAHLDQLISHLTPIDDSVLAHPPNSDWLMFGHDWSAHRFSPLNQINRLTVHSLTLAWSASFPTGTNGIEPLVHDGVLFVNSNGTVQALEAATGDLIWEFVRNASSTRVPTSQPRGVALYGDSLFVPTVDNHIIALDVRTGKVRWDQQIGKPEERLELTAAPLVVHGKVIQGVSGCQGHTMPGGCFIVALDTSTGREAWRFNTIARPNQPGGNSWNGAPIETRFGGSVWNTGSYDPELNLVYFGTGQTYMISTLLRPGVKGANRDALFTNSTLALNPDTGKLAWYYQHFPGDVWDLDWSFEQTIVEVPGDGQMKKAIVTAGKLGIIDAVDAATGRYLWSHDLGMQNLVTRIDPRTGRKDYNVALLPKIGASSLICPSALGVRNWPASAYEENSGTLFFPLVRSCMDFSLQDTSDHLNSKTDVADFTFGRRVPPDSDGHFGEVAAVEVANQTTAWRSRRRYPQMSAALVTSGGVLFEGSSDRYFRALDSSTGKLLWHTRLDEVPNGFPITFMVGTTQYVAIMTGGGSPFELFFRDYTPEIRRSIGAKTLMVFALPSDTPD